MHQHEAGSVIPSKQADTHAATIRAIERKRRAHKKNNPFGKLPARIARTEIGIEAMCAVQDDALLFEKAERAEIVLDRQEMAICSAFIARHITRSAFEEGRQRISAARWKLIREIDARRKAIHDRILPELKNLVAQSERAA